MDTSSIVTVEANDMEFAYFTKGSGPLAMCLHGYPDTAYTYRHLIEPLAHAGFQVVAPFNRGYSPTSLAPDGLYQGGALGVDANALHEVLNGDDQAILVGHDWGAMGVYAAAGIEPSRWKNVVAMAVPPGPVTAEAFFSYDQLKMSWYMFFQLTELSDMVVPNDDFEFVRRLWADWSPGYDAAFDVDAFIKSVSKPEHLQAALSYYRHTLDARNQDEKFQEAQSATLSVPPQPLLYLHGANDGCMAAQHAETARAYLDDDHSAVKIVPNSGHFLHLEQPEQVNNEIIAFLSS